MVLQKNNINIQVIQVDIIWCIYIYYYNNIKMNNSYIKKIYHEVVIGTW
jgi:hypothetical protein